jgi:transcriptional regulator with XRE-family HTH domain
MTKTYDHEVLEYELLAIKNTRKVTFKQLASYFSVSVSHLYRVRKGKRTSLPLFNQIESAYAEVFERFFVLLLVLRQDYYYVEYHVSRQYKGALRQVAIAEALSRVKESFITTNAESAKSKLRAWLSEYRIENKEYVTGLINFRIHATANQTEID